VLLDPSLTEMVGLPNVDVTTLAEHAVHTRSPESQVILCGPKETGVLLWGYAHRLDIVLG
jgi:hypothetical protein